MYRYTDDILCKQFGQYGGRYVPEMLISPLEELEAAFTTCIKDDAFLKQLNHIQSTYNGRPSPLYFAQNLSDTLVQTYSYPEHSKVYLKLETLNHTGAHKMNNVLGQIMLAKHMGKKKIVAETGAGQHGVATAAACAKFNMECKVFMGTVDVKRQFPNVFSMRMMEADVIEVTDGTRTLKDAVNAALKYWVEHVDDTHYLLGSALGPYPYPSIVQYFQSIIGLETKEQFAALSGKAVPDAIVACVGGGSNALGIFTPFIDDESIQLIGVEAGGHGIESTEHAARFNSHAEVGIAQGYKSYFLQNDEGQLAHTHSISAGLDYAGVSPYLAYLHDTKRVHFEYAKDEEALQGYQLLARTEGIIPAMESAHAMGIFPKLLKHLQGSVSPSEPLSFVVNVSGRGDKDLFIVAPQLEAERWRTFLKGELEKNG